MKKDTSCRRANVDDKLIKNATNFLEQKQVEILKNAKIFSLLGNEVRLKIITLFLEYDRMCVCDLSDILQMKQSPISQHLRKLKDGDLLNNKREGMTIFYFIPENIRNFLKRRLSCDK